jgi:GntR family transcriptional regulator
MGDLRALTGEGGSGAASPGFRPLYRQVKELLTRRIADRIWSPGEGIPSEQQIAAELGVSQGTVRKALDEMTAENLLVRRQGRGTFVATHSEARILFQFFKIVPDGEKPVFPESVLRSVSRGQANVIEREKLRLGPGEAIIRISRVRSLRGRVTISEYLSLPARLFPGLAEGGEVPNNLYDHFASRYGITISGGQETVRAVAASVEDAALLGLPVGAALLAVDRVAMALDGTPVEWRYSLCDTAACGYVSDLR